MDVCRAVEMGGGVSATQDSRAEQSQQQQQAGAQAGGRAVGGKFAESVDPGALISCPKILPLRDTQSSQRLPARKIIWRRRSKSEARSRWRALAMQCC